MALNVLLSKATEETDGGGRWWTTGQISKSCPTVLKSALTSVKLRELVLGDGLPEAGWGGVDRGGLENSSRDSVFDQAS